MNRVGATLLSVVFATVVLIGCTNKNKIPADILSKEKMEMVIWDMVLADRFASQFVIKDTAKVNLRDETFRIYSEVFAIHKISKDEFVKSYRFYMTRPDLSRVMFDTIYARANRLKEENYRPKMAKPLDSATVDSAKIRAAKIDSAKTGSAKLDSLKPASGRATVTKVDSAKINAAKASSARRDSIRARTLKLKPLRRIDTTKQ